MARVCGWYKRSTQITLIVIAVALTVGLNANSITLAQRLWTDPTVRAAVVQQATGALANRMVSASPGTLNHAADSVDAVTKLGLPIGWTGNRHDPSYVRLTSVGAVVKVLGGWLLTIIAVSLGAPFWFDTLSRAARLRSSGQSSG